MAQMTAMDLFRAYLKRPSLLAERLRYLAARPGSPNYGRGKYWTSAVSDKRLEELRQAITERVGPRNPPPLETKGVFEVVDRRMSTLPRTKGAPQEIEVFQGRGGSKMVRFKRDPSLPPRAPEAPVPVRAPEPLPPTKAPGPRMSARLGRGAAPAVTTLLGAPILDYLIRTGEAETPFARTLRQRSRRMEI